MKEKFRIFDGFWIKVLALLLMTIDHVGAFLQVYANNLNNTLMYDVGFAFRCVGRLAFPLFILLMVEAVKYSKNEWKYLLRIGILATVILIPQVILGYTVDSSIHTLDNPLIDLSLCALTLILLKQKNWKSIFAVLPVAYIIVCTVIQFIEVGGSTTVIWLPHYVRSGYSLLGLILSLGFYYSTSLARKLASKITGFSEDSEQLPEFQGLINAFMIAILIVVNLFIYFLSQFQNNGIYVLDIYTSNIQTWSIFAGLIIFFYSGKKGYSKAWFKYGAYAYFPVHIILLFLIFYILLGVPGGF